VTQFCEKPSLSVIEVQPFCPIASDSTHFWEGTAYEDHHAGSELPELRRHATARLRRVLLMLLQLLDLLLLLLCGIGGGRLVLDP
jgi:hypothetical protein